jgi:hypothetical protein
MSVSGTEENVSTLGELVEKLVAKWQIQDTRASVSISGDIQATTFLARKECARELAAALAAEGQGPTPARLSLEEVRQALTLCPGYLGAFSNADFNFVTEYLNGLLVSPELRTMICGCRDCMYHGAIFRQWEHMQKAGETPTEMGTLAAAPSLHKEGKEGPEVAR